MPLFTTDPTDQAFERFMKHQPNYKPDTPEADRIQAELDAETKQKGRTPMIYRDERHQHTFEKERSIRPESVSRKFLAALYLLTADGGLWNQVWDQVTIRKIYIDEMRPKNLTGTGYVFFSATKDILTGSDNIQLTDIADPALLSMQLTLLAMAAQEESTSISKNMRWSIQKRMENGTFTGCTAPYGYRLENGNLVIVPEEAAIVQRIFEMHLAGIGQNSIVQELNRNGIPNREGTPWHISRVHYILSNEKYIGDSLMQKKFTSNPLTHERRRNYGEFPQYYIHNSHQGIVGRDEFERIQNSFESHTPSRPQQVHTFVHRIQCPDCGRHYRHILSSGKSYWSCPNQVNGIKSCRVLRLPEKAIKIAFLILVGKLYTNQGNVLHGTFSLLEEIAARQEQGNAKLYELNAALADLNEKAHTLQRLHNKGFIEDADFREQSDALAAQRKKLTDQRAQAVHGSKALETLDKLRKLQEQLEALPEIPWEFDIELFDQLVEKIIPISNTELTFKLKCGLELKEVLPK